MKIHRLEEKVEKQDLGKGWNQNSFRDLSNRNE